MMELHEIGPIEQVLDRVRLRARVDKLAERRRARWRGWMLLVGIAGVAGFVLGVVLLEQAILPEPWAVRFILGSVAVGLVGAIYCGFRAHRAGLADVDDRKYELVRDILAPLVPEVRPGRDCRVSIDFHHFAERPPEETHKASFFSSVKSELYAHPWLELELPLRDGTTALVRGRTSCKRKRKRKRKYTKITDKIRERLEVVLRPAKGSSVDPVRAEAMARRLVRVPGLEPIGVRASARSVELRFRTGVGRVVSGRGVHRDIDALLAPPMVLRALVAGHRALRGATGV